MALGVVGSIPITHPYFLSRLRYDSVQRALKSLLNGPIVQRPRTSRFPGRQGTKALALAFKQSVINTDNLKSLLNGPIVQRPGTSRFPGRQGTKALALAFKQSVVNTDNLTSI